MQSVPLNGDSVTRYNTEFRISQSQPQNRSGVGPLTPEISGVIQFIAGPCTRTCNTAKHARYLCIMFSGDTKKMWLVLIWKSAALIAQNLNPSSTIHHFAAFRPYITSRMDHASTIFIEIFSLCWQQLHIKYSLHHKFLTTITIFYYCFLISRAVASSLFSFRQVWIHVFIYFLLFILFIQRVRSDFGILLLMTLIESKMWNSKKIVRNELHACTWKDCRIAIGKSNHFAEKFTTIIIYLIKKHE